MPVQPLTVGERLQNVGEAATGLSNTLSNYANLQERQREFGISSAQDQQKIEMMKADAEQRATQLQIERDRLTQEKAQHDDVIKVGRVNQAANLVKTGIDIKDTTSRKAFFARDAVKNSITGAYKDMGFDINLDALIAGGDATQKAWQTVLQFQSAATSGQAAKMSDDEWNKLSSEYARQSSLVFDNIEHAGAVVESMNKYRNQQQAVQKRYQIGGQPVSTPEELQTAKEVGLQAEQVNAPNGTVQLGPKGAARSGETASRVLRDTIDIATGNKRTGQNSPLQMSARRVNLAGDGLRLISQIQSGQLKSIKSVDTELLRNIDSLVSQGQGSAELVREMHQRTGYSDIQGLITYLTSHPKDTIAQGFLATYKEQILGQQSYWRDIRNREIDGQEAKISDILQDPKAQKIWDDALNKTYPDYQPKQGTSTSSTISDADLNKLIKGK